MKKTITLAVLLLSVTMAMASRVVLFIFIDCFVFNPQNYTLFFNPSPVLMVFLIF